MKKNLLTAFVALVVSFLSFTSCDKEGDDIISFKDLPATAQTLITEHFSSSEVLMVTFDKELFDHEYTVLLKDATSIQFNKAGEWESIESRQTGVPMSVIPTKIATYLTEAFADQKVFEIEREKNGFEVTLSSLMELNFNKEGELIAVDND